MPVYSKLEHFRFTARLADAEVVQISPSFAGPEISLPGPEHMAAIATPVLIFRCIATGAPDSAIFRIEAQSVESGEWIPVAGSDVLVDSGGLSTRLEIGNLGLATKLRLAATDLSGIDSSNYYTVTASLEGIVG